MADPNNVCCLRPYWLMALSKLTNLSVEYQLTRYFTSPLWLSLDVKYFWWQLAFGVTVTFRLVYFLSFRLGTEPLKAHDQRSEISFCKWPLRPYSLHNIPTGTGCRIHHLLLLAGLRWIIRMRLRKSRVKVKVVIRLTVSRPLCFAVKVSSWYQDQVFITVRKMCVCWCGASSLAGGRVYRLQLPLILTSAVILEPDSRGT
jgi:hypothetical protein